MTSLHYTLIALGVGLVGALMLYNFFQERRSRKQAERIFQPRDGDVSLNDLSLPDGLRETRIEPHIELLDDDGPALQPVAMTEPDEDYAAVETAKLPPVGQLINPEPAGQGAPTMAPESPLDGEVEYIARLRYAQPSAIQFTTLQENLRRISKPIRMIGRRGDGAWEPVLGHAARTYDTVELSLLLADRTGPVSEVQLETFCQRLYEFATEHGGAVSCQDKAVAVDKAKALDAFCAEVDMLIGLNVMPPAGAGFDGREIHALATRAGMVQSIDGIFTLRSADGQLLFTLTDGASVSDGAPHGISLLFDVPRVGQSQTAFDRMIGLGLQLAEQLGGQLVDDGGRPVNRASLEKDKRSLETIYARMAARGIPAGGERALRLFA